MELWLLQYYLQQQQQQSILQWKWSRNCYLFILAETYANQNQRNSVYANWLKQQVSTSISLQFPSLPSSSQIQAFFFHSIHSSFPFSFTPTFFSLFLRGFDTPLVTVQTYFYSAVNTLIQTYSQLFFNQIILSAIKRGMISTYISVREKNMKLLLSATSQYPRLLITYYPVILKGLIDHGISVRKVSSHLLYQLTILLLKPTVDTTQNVNLLEDIFKLACGYLMKEEDKTIRSNYIQVVSNCLLLEQENASLFSILVHNCEFFLASLEQSIGENEERSTCSLALLKELNEHMDKSRMQSSIHWLLTKQFDDYPVLIEY